MNIYEHFCIIYSAFYDLLLSDSTYFGQRTHFNHKLSFSTSEVFLTLCQGPILFLIYISFTLKHSHKMTNPFNSYCNFLFSLNKAPLRCSIVLSFLSFSLFGLSCLSCFSFSIQYVFTLLVLSPCHHPFFVFLTSPHICSSFLLFFVEEAAIRSRHHAQALFFRISCALMRQATNFKRAQLAPYTMGLCTMSLLGVWVFHWRASAPLLQLEFETNSLI